MLKGEKRLTEEELRTYGYCGGLNSMIVSETLALNQVGRVFDFFDQAASILY